MVTNGQKTLSELLAAVERDRQREREEAEREHRERLEAELAAVNAKLGELTKPPPLARSKMSVRAKSDYIAEHGRAAYEALPW